MQINYVLGTPVFSAEATIEPVLLAEMKKYLNLSIDENYFDELITQLITTARQQLEGCLNLSLIARTVTARLQNDAGYMQLPYSAPVLAITSVTNNDDVAVTSDTYSLKGNMFCGYSKLGTPANNFYSPCVNIYNVTYSVAYTGDVLPVHFKTAIMQQVGWLYERRGDEIESSISPLVRISLKPYRQVN